MTDDDGADVSLSANARSRTTDSLNKASKLHKGLLIYVVHNFISLVVFQWSSGRGEGSGRGEALRPITCRHELNGVARTESVPNLAAIYATIASFCCRRLALTGYYSIWGASDTF